MIKKYPVLIIVLVFVFFSEAALAQISQGGTPRSVRITKNKQHSQQVEAIKMPFVDVDKLRAEDVIVDQIRDIPWRFGQNIEVDINIITDGTKVIFEDGSKLWRIKIVSQGAVSLNFLFDRFFIPPGAELFIYNSNFTDIIGAFTDFNNRDDSVFATVPLRGDDIIIEYFEPAFTDFEGILHISRVTHGYRGPHDFEKAFGGSGSCNVNVACPQSAGMENQIRSVAMLVSGGNGFCSGSLINNTNNNGTPYFLSADHCYSNPSSVVYWFNWQSATCANPPTSPTYQSISGATDRARYSTSDVWLVQLSSTPPANYNIYYSGWNRTSDNNISGKVWGIHHPSGDIKKISWSNLGVSTTTYLQNSVPGNGTHWRVTQWSDGTTTEGGSSGSPLFDPDGRIIGQLHGGYASCTSLTSDWYGKLGVSWTGGGTNATRLSNWLDPGNTGVMVLNGYDPNVPSYALDVQMLNIISPSDEICSSGSVIPQVTIKNVGSQTLTSATVSYVLNGGSPVSVNWTGSLTTGQSANVSFPAVTFAIGTGQTFEAVVSNPNGGNDQNLSNNTLSKSFSVQLGFALPFSENFNSSANLPGCWQIIDHQGNGQVWQFGTGGSMNGTTGNYAFLNSDAYGNGNSQNSDLVTPTIDMTGYTNVTLNFTHYFRQYTGSSATLYYSINNGSTWNTIQTWTVTTSNPLIFSQVIPAVANQSQVKFKWNYTGTWGYYWSVDDISITGTPSCTTPGVPAGLNATSTGTTTANLSWSSGTPAGSPTVTYTWEVRTTGGTVVTSGSTGGTTATATGLSSNTTYNFRVSATTSCNGTASGWSPSSTNFITYPSDPVSANASPSVICQGNNTQLFAGGAQGTVYWYTGNCGGTFVGTGNPITVSPTITTTYYARNFNGNYSTGCSDVTVTVHSLPVVSTAIDGSRCGTGTVNISVTDVPPGCTTDWYTLPSGGVLLSPGATNFTTPVIGTTTTYYAETRDLTTGCKSNTRIAVTATIKSIPSAPSASYNSPVCAGTELQLSATYITGADYLWTGPGGFVSAEQNPTVSLTSTTQMSGVYEVTATVDGCTSNPGVVQVEVHPLYYTVIDTSVYDYDLPYSWEGGSYFVTGSYYENNQSIYGCDSILQLNLTVISTGNVKTITLKVYLEGLYSSTNPGQMNEAQNENGSHYGSGQSDMITVEMYDATNPTQLYYQNINVIINTDGVAMITDVPLAMDEEYYIVIKHRNSIETWSGQPIILTGSGPFLYDFTTSATKAYGNNMKSVNGGYYAIYGGDVNQDGIIDGTDMSMLDNASTVLLSGYVVEDVNGDGIVDGSDMAVIDNNSTNLIQKQQP